jgi:polyphosphate kinase
MKKLKYFIQSRETSWLSFNDRVLQEAADKTVPLIDRIKFLGIFSSNLDEFFSIRVAALKRLEKHKYIAVKDENYGANEVLKQVLSIVMWQQQKFKKVYDVILTELESENIHIVNEKQLTAEQGSFIRKYFVHNVMSTLAPIMIDDIKTFPYLKDKRIYLAVKLQNKTNDAFSKHSIIEIPTSVLPRFIEISSSDESINIMLLDDLIRYCLDDLFYTFDYDKINAWTIKLTRDAEIDIDSDFEGNFVDKVSQGIKKRKKGVPARFVYDKSIPKEFLKSIIKRMHLTTEDLIAGGRYHNFKDFIDFPNVGRNYLSYQRQTSLPHKHLKFNSSIISAIKKRDSIIHLPYQSFAYVINFIREAAIDPDVKSIKITLYRVAKNSNIINALINAARNGKVVTVAMEIQARFDEEANIYWANKLVEEGIKVIYGFNGMKIHAKICLISREEKGKIVYYANLGTGNYNESTARLYCDHSLFTARKSITNEVAKLFKQIETKKKAGNFKHLIVAPKDVREAFISLIDIEIKNKQVRKPAYIIIKLNHLVDKKLMDKLYEAADAGVKIDVIVRTTCTFMPLSPNINIISIVDRFLEHARMYVFCNNNNPKYYLSSSDWMPRNLDGRVEVTFPIYSKHIQNELQAIIDLQLADNTKARVINPLMDNTYQKTNEKNKVKSQVDIYNMLSSH